MERATVLALAVLSVLYFTVTEILDWTGRIEVIRRHFPRFPKFLERRIFRVALLFAAIGLLIDSSEEFMGKLRLR